MENFLSKLKNLSIRPNGSESLPSSLRPDSTAKPTPVVPVKSVPKNDPVDPATQSGKRFRMGKPLHRRYSFWLALVALGGSGALALGIWSIEKSLPDVSSIASFSQNGTLTIKAADGVVLQQLGSATRQKLSIKQVPDRVIKAFIAAEDRRFYQHNGVDYQSIVRAVASNLLARDLVEGGSTITQQVARIVYLNQDRTMGRKLHEAFLAQKIERHVE